MAKKVRKKRKQSGGGGGGGGGSAGGGGVLMSLRGGFGNAARAAVGGKPKTKTGRVVNHIITVALVALVAYVLWRRFG